MSLAVLADHMASKGRGGDSMLIHMAPSEIRGLQALAVANGSSLTINPDTGLPEALSLKKLLPAIIGFGITAMTGIPAWQVGLGVGAVETARTGDLGKGISAGLGAYGGAGLGAGFSTAGAEAIGSQAAGQSYLASAPGVLVDAGAGLSGDMAYNLTNAGVTDTVAANAAQQAAAERIAAATPYDKLSAGFDAAKANPSSLLTKDNFKYMAAAAAPVLADQAVKSNLPVTATKPGSIRPYSYDPYGGTYTAGIPYEAMPTKAAGGGLMGMNDGGYAPSQLNFAQQSEPVMRMAEGGIAGFAIGGDTKAALEQAYAANDVAKINELVSQNQITAADVGGTWKDFNTSGLAGMGVNLYNPTAEKLYQETGSWDAAAKARDDAANAANAATWNKQNADTWAADAAKRDAAANAANQATWAAQPIQYTEDQMGAYLTAHPEMTIDEAIKATNADRTAVNKFLAKTTSPFVGSTEDKGGSGTLGIYNQWKAMGVSPDEYYAAALANDSKYAGWTKGMLNTGFNLDKGALALAAAEKDGVSDKEWVNFMDTNGYTINDMAQSFGLSLKEVRDRYNAVKNAEKKVTGTGGTGTTIIPGVNDYGLGGTGTSGRLEDVLGTALPPGVSGAGITTVNPNGTITTRPNIPGIPEGGFTGMTDLRNAYTKGGGSLGYIPYAPKTIDEFNAKYKNTGGSKAAYDYLMGKAPYSPIPVTPTGEIQKPYWESVGRFPENRQAKKYVFVNGKYQLNPDYVKPSYVLAGEKAAADKAAEDTKTTGTTGTPDLTDQSKPPTTDPGSGNEWLWDYASKKWYISEIQKAANGGLMAMAGGGMAEQFNLGGYSDGGRLLRGPGDGVSDSIPATIGNKRPARLADGEFVVPARIVSELGNGSTEAGARKLYAMMDRVQAARKGSIGKGKVAKNSRADKYLPA